MTYKERKIDPQSTLIDALKQMDKIDKKLLIVEDSQKEQYVGLLSMGDIQRGIIGGLELNTSIIKVLRKEIKVAKAEDSFNSIKQMMIKYRMELCPVISDDNKIQKIYYWEDIFNDEHKDIFQDFNLPVVIMAGGYGTRLKPLTNVLPKPLIPINDQTIIEDIFDKFSLYGCDDFYLSVNYKSELIKYYIKEKNLPFSIHYSVEDKPLGTAGGLSLLRNKINKTFFVTNCDILIDEDYSKILNYHNKNKNDITLVTAIKSFPISYGIVETDQNGLLVNIKEKPDFNVQINSGMYIIEPHILDKIPGNTFYHITELINQVIEDKGKIGVFPVSNRSWIDIGNWNQYLNKIL